MPSWFSKLFDSANKPSSNEERTDLPTGSDYLAMVLDEEPEAPPPRQVIQGTVLEEETDVVTDAPAVRIKAAVLSPASCRFMVDRPVLEGGYSLAILGPEAMHHSPLAESLFDLGGIEAAVITYFFDGQEPYKVRLDAVTLDTNSDLNLLYERPLATFNV